MNFVVLGKGRLGSHLTASLRTKHIPYSHISGRDLYTLATAPYTSSDVVIDAMDLSGDTDENYSIIQKRINSTRLTLLSSTTPLHYIYISSVKVYHESCHLITEDSELLSEDSILDSLYVANKLHNETVLSEMRKDNISVLRSPALWTYSYLDSDNGFFPDLIRSRINSNPLPLVSGDDKIISYSNYRDIAEIILSIINSSLITCPLLNLSTQNWSSRRELKLQLPHSPSPSTGGLRITSNYYSHTDFLSSAIQLP